MLFAGILFSHFGVAINEPVLDFVKDFGLILFVYMIGLQVGPGFFASFRRLGLAINLQAVSVVVLGVGVAILFHLLFSLPISTLVGILAGAATNTPSLGAAQQALKDIAGLPGDALRLTGLGYAVAYPFGVLGVILSIVMMKFLFRVQLQKETESFRRVQAGIFPLPDSVNLEVKNPQLSGKRLQVLGEVVQADIVVSRILRRGNLFLPDGDSTLEPGDILLAVGSRASLDKLKLPGRRREPGRPEEISRQSAVEPDPRHPEKSDRTASFGTSATAALRREHHPRPTRRHGVCPQSGGDICNSVDKLTVVGEEDMIQQLSILLGNSMKRLDFPDIMPVFLGIIIGVLAGALPIVVPGVPVPLKLGIAGGPLIVAILMAPVWKCRPLQLLRFEQRQSDAARGGHRPVSRLRGTARRVRVRHRVAQRRRALVDGPGRSITLVPVWLVALFSRLILKETSWSSRDFFPAA